MIIGLLHSSKLRQVSSRQTTTDDMTEGMYSLTTIRDKTHSKRTKYTHSQLMAVQIRTLPEHNTTPSIRYLCKLIRSLFL